LPARPAWPGHAPTGSRSRAAPAHWGDEDVVQPSGFELRLAGKLARSPDITAIADQHVHVVQPIRIIHGKLVVFGEGNLISNQISACCPAASQDGMIVLLTISVDGRGARVRSIHYLPIWVRLPATWCSPPTARGAPTPPTPQTCANRYTRGSGEQIPSQVLRDCADPDTAWNTSARRTEILKAGHDPRWQLPHRRRPTWALTRRGNGPSLRLRQAGNPAAGPPDPPLQRRLIERGGGRGDDPAQRQR